MEKNMKTTTSLNSVIVLGLSLCAQTASAGDLRECRQKVYEMFHPLEKTEVRQIAGGAHAAYARTDLFVMSPGNTCGVEIVEDQGTVRVDQFERADSARPLQIKMQVFTREGSQILGVKKFETIKLNEFDPAYADGRINGHASCEVVGDSVVYETDTPVYADGVKSAFGVTRLKLSRMGDQVLISLTAGVRGALWPFKSVTACAVKN
jgi:hypothetical protein